MLAIFAVVFYSLTRLVFYPTLKILEERTHQTQGLKLDAQNLTGDTEKKMLLLEEEVRKNRLQAAKEREALVASGRKEEGRILEEARQKNESLLKDLQSKLNQEKLEATFKLKAAALQLAREMTDKILERRAA